MHQAIWYRLICVGLLLALLSSCTVYDRIFHPHRLRTPPMSPEARAKLKASEKARHKGLTLQPTGTDAATDANAAGGGATPEPAAADKTKSYSELPAGTRATYDKQGLLKRSRLERWQLNGNKLHHYDTHPLKPTAVTRDERRLRKHSKKGKGKEPPMPKMAAEPDAPAPDPTQPAPAPAAKPARVQPEKAPTPKPEKVKEPKAEKPKKTKKDPKAPKPDPTQPLNGDQ